VVTTAGAGTSSDGINLGAGAYYGNIFHVLVDGSDSQGIDYRAENDIVNVPMRNNWILSADENCVYVNSLRGIIQNNQINNCGNDGIYLTDKADHMLITGNRIRDQGESPIDNQNAATNVVCSGNRMDGAINGSCTDGNEATAF